jgi:hypothetical protein
MQLQSLDDFGESAIGVGVGADEPYTSNMSIERGRAASVLPSHTPVARGMSMTPLAHDDLATPIPSELGDDNFGAADFDQRLFVGECCIPTNFQCIHGDVF